MKNKEYEELINQLANRFAQSIPEKEKELVNEFAKYLDSVISNLKRRGKAEEEIKRGISTYTEYIIRQDLEEKKMEIIVDNSFEKIKQISNEFFGMAKRTLDGEQMNPEEDFSKRINEMKKLLTTVKEYNVQQAKSLISEAIIDSNYITNPQSGFTSIRIAHEIKRKEEEEAIKNKMEGEER